MTICNIEGCQDHYGCRLRAKGIQQAASAMATRTLNMVPKRVEAPARNKEIIYSERPDGTKVPIIKASGDVLRRKEYEENRHSIESNIRRIRTADTSQGG